MDNSMLTVVSTGYMPGMQTRHCCLCVTGVLVTFVGLMVAMAGISFVINYRISDLPLPPQWQNEKAKKHIGIAMIVIGLSSLATGILVSLCFFIPMKAVCLRRFKELRSLGRTARGVPKDAPEDDYIGENNENLQQRSDDSTGSKTSSKPALLVTQPSNLGNKIVLPVVAPTSPSFPPPTPSTSLPSYPSTATSHHDYGFTQHQERKHRSRKSHHKKHAAKRLAPHSEEGEVCETQITGDHRSGMVHRKRREMLDIRQGELIERRKRELMIQDGTHPPPRIHGDREMAVGHVKEDRQHSHQQGDGFTGLDTQLLSRNHGTVVKVPVSRRNSDEIIQTFNSRTNATGIKLPSGRRGSDGIDQIFNATDVKLPVSRRDSGGIDQIFHATDVKLPVSRRDSIEMDQTFSNSNVITDTHQLFHPNVTPETHIFNTQETVDRHFVTTSPDLQHTFSRHLNADRQQPIFHTQTELEAIHRKSHDPITRTNSQPNIVTDPLFMKQSSYVPSFSHKSNTDIEGSSSIPQPHSTKRDYSDNCDILPNTVNILHNESPSNLIIVSEIEDDHPRCDSTLRHLDDDITHLISDDSHDNTMTSYTNPTYS